MYTNYLSGLLGEEVDGFDIISAIVDLLGNTGQVLCIIALVMGIVGCFFGFKLTKLFMAVCGFFAGLTIGVVLGIAKNESKYFALGVVLAIVLAIIAYKLYKLGVFIISFMNTATFSFVLALTLFKESKPALVVACIIGLIVGIVSIFFTKPTLIISTSVSYGNMAGTFLAVLLSNKTMSKILPLVFIAVGIFIQIKTNNGLFEGVAQETADHIRDEISGGDSQ